MIKPVKVPRGIANLFALGNSYEIKIMQDFEYRPDKILEALNIKSMKGEFTNNYMSNASPITLKKNNRYLITDEVFEGVFANGGK